MKPEKVFKRYDVRGKYPEELDEEFAERIGCSVAEFCNENYGNQVVVCRDNKESSKQLKNSLINGLRCLGVDVVDVGIGTTDYAAYCGKEKGSISVQVTSSHMPLGFNGFKFMYPEGNGFVNEDLNKLEQFFRENEFDKERNGELKENNRSEEYLDSLTSFAEDNFDLVWKDKSVVIDCLGGSSLPFVYRALERLGCDVYCVDIEREGQSLDDFSPYRDPPNPEGSQLDVLKDLVDERDADLGLSFDMDGDRVSVYHDNSLVSGDEVFAILSSINRGSVVGSIDTSSCVGGIVCGRGDDIYYTRVGDPFVLSEALSRDDVSFAGEPNGHYSFLDFVPYNSGCLAGVILAGIDDLADKRSSLLCRKVFRESIIVDDKNDSMRNVEDFVEDEGCKVVSDIDGVKFEYEGSIVLVRTSGSSDKLRFVIESDEEPEKVFDKLRKEIF